MPRIPHRIRAGAFALALALPLAVPATPARAVVLPPGFVDEQIRSTFVNPTNLKFLPDGRLLVTEKRGRLYMIDADSTLRLLWSGEASVLDSYDRGLLGVEVDPTFPTGRWIYLLHSVDPDSNNVEDNEDNWGRLMRMQMAGNDRSLNTGSRQILFGTTWSDGALHGSYSHAIGGLKFARDGSLLVSVGDGAHYGYLDPGGYDAPLFAAGKGDPAEDIGAFRAHYLQSLDGKLLRLDPNTGLGLPSNPYYDGNASSRRSKVYAYGLRNAFRFTVKPGTGSTLPGAGDPGIVYYGDVGWDTWEEFGAIRIPGSDMGWPCFEGEHAQLQYQAATPSHDGCAPNGPTPVMPLVTFNHYDPSLSSIQGISCSCAVGGVFYTGTSYPPAYRGGFFMADYVESWIKVMRTDAQDNLQTLLEFATDADNPVAFAVSPLNGDVYYVSISTGLIHHIRFSGGTVGAPAPTAALGLQLSEPRPNPSRGAVRFGIQMPKDGTLTFEIFDAQGRIVWSAPPGQFAAGPAALSWPGVDNAGAPAGNGLYFARVRTMDGGQVTRKFVMAR